VTQNIRQAAHRWVEAASLSHAALARRIRDDGIDILVDLSMHMANNRLLVFARKPAPIQVTYLAYCSTTGLPTIDYRLTDPYLDPPEPAASGRTARDRFYCEQSVYLPRSYWCYHPGVETPEVNPLPAARCGYVTFINLNNFAKNSPAALQLWAKVLGAVPDSRLILHSSPGSHRDGVWDFFAARGVARARLDILDTLPLPAYFRQYHQADIALDPFPYPGGTTTCDALWMGVPVVSLVGYPAYTRSGKSILTNAGLPWLAVDTQDQYRATAVALARDLPRLAQLRATLRPQMQASILMDAPGFTRDLESVYRTIWRRWCQTPTGADPTGCLPPAI
jgi:predicted O-linked N-acetylglucosamine transferase (SPINDLY family)